MTVLQRGPAPATPSRPGAEASAVEQRQRCWAVRARALPRQLVTGALAPLKKGYDRLKKRYGPHYTKALLLVVFLAFFSPVPGTTLVAVAAVVAVAEVHRAVSRRRLCRGKRMFISCDVILRWDATPAQLRAVGASLWGWCSRAAGAAGIYRQLDDQALADLIAGRLPAPGRAPRQADGRGVPVRLADEVSPDRRAALVGLRDALPAQGVEDVLVGGTSWNQIEASTRKGGTTVRRPGPVRHPALAAEPQEVV